MDTRERGYPCEIYILQGSPRGYLCEGLGTKFINNENEK